MNNKKLVSVIIPCYKQAQYLGEALQSVLEQSYENWECIIVNDGSPDNTDNIAKDWLRKDVRYKYLRIENGGVSHARNIGIENAKGEFILPLDADDCLSENYLEECVKNIEKRTIKVVYGKVVFFGEQEGELPRGKASLENLLKVNCIHCAGLYRKKDWELNYGYDKNMIHGFEDWEFWINLLKNGGEALLLEQCTLNYRIKPHSRSTEIIFDYKKNEKMRDYIFQKHIKLFGFSSTYGVFKEKLKLEDKLINIQSSLTWKELLELFYKKIKRTLSLYILTRK